MKERYTQSEKTLDIRAKRPLTFYKSIKMKTIKTQFRIKSQQKNIQIQKNPWNKTFNQKQISIILKRLNDTPATLYTAFEQKINQNKQNLIPNKNKFKQLLNFNIGPRLKINKQNRNKNYSNYNSGKSKIRSKIEHQSVQKQKQTIKQANLLKKIKEMKKKYIDQYRKMLMSMKCINPDTDLPRIKYVQQNIMSDKINQLHASSTLKISK